MASSRVFVKGLPPTFSEADFRKHFSQKQHDVTDIRIFSNRRIGYVGYRTPEDAQAAVKYFNKTFIRMSRIVVELARPVDEGRFAEAASTVKNDMHQMDGPDVASAPQKRKRGNDAPVEDDPKLQEYLHVMKSKKQKKDLGDQALDTPLSVVDVHAAAADTLLDGESDGEYEQVVKKTNEKKTAEQTAKPAGTNDTSASPAQEITRTLGTDNISQESHNERGQALSDAEWARSRTSRLLGLEHESDNEEDDPVMSSESRPHEPDVASDMSSEDENVAPVANTKKETQSQVLSSMPTPPSEDNDEHAPALDTDVQAARASRRLFVRNLPYGVDEAELESLFARYGRVQEVSPLSPSSTCTVIMMNFLIGTAYASAFDENRESILVDASHV